ncbi:hypothetical protein KI387_035472, partial [Taxus chinensis]
DFASERGGSVEATFVARMVDVLNGKMPIDGGGGGVGIGDRRIGSSSVRPETSALTLLKESYGVVNERSSPYEELDAGNGGGCGHPPQ